MPAEIVRYPYNKTAWAQLQTVNFTLNHAKQYVTDLEQFGKVEFWEYISGKYGDCEDFALTKMRMLRALGWPLGSLDIGICRDHDGNGHAILIAHLDTGDFIADNNSDHILPWKSAPYSWVEMSVGGSFLPGDWRKVGA